MRTALFSALCCGALLGLTLAPEAVQASGIAKKPVAQKSAANQAATKTATKAAPKSKTKATSTATRSKGAAKKAGAAAVGAGAGAAAAAQNPGRLAVHSGAALVVEQDSAVAYYQKNANAVMPIASITKLMTAMVVLDGVPDLKAPVTIGEEDVDYLKGSSSRLRVGATMSRETALLLALMSSENRASHALARHYPGGMPAFLAAMNIKAQSLGMRDTHFEDPTGLNSHNVSTASDLAKMVAAAYRYPLIRELSTTPEAIVEVSGREMGFRNTNPLVKNMAWDVGLSKTGYISEAGKCLVMQARVADKPVVIVLLDSVGKLTRVGDANRIRRWMEYNYASGKSGTKTALDLRPGFPG